MPRKKHVAVKSLALSASLHIVRSLRQVSARAAAGKLLTPYNDESRESAGGHFCGTEVVKVGEVRKATRFQDRSGERSGRVSCGSRDCLLLGPGLSTN